MANDIRFNPVRILEKLPLDQIEPLEGQPRGHFDPVALDDLAGSMKAMGQSDAIKVVRMSSQPPRFKLVDGERRYRSAKKANLETVYAIEGEVVAEGKAKTLPLQRQLYILASGSNIPKAGYLPIEFARMLVQVQQDLELTNLELATRYNVSPPTVSNHFIILRLPLKVQKMMEGKVPADKRLKLSLAIMLDGYPEKVQVEMALRAVQEKWTARELAFHLREAVAKKNVVRIGARRRTPADDRKLLDGVLDKILERLHIATGIPLDSIEAIVRNGGPQLKRMYVASFNDIIKTLAEMRDFVSNIDLRKVG